MNFDLKILDLFKLPVKIMLTIAVVSGMILFFPEQIVERIYMTDFRNSYGFIISLVFLISSSTLIINLITTIWRYCHKKILWRKFYRTAKERLEKLDDYEKVIVYALFNEDNYTGELPYNDGAVKKLKHKLIIIETTNLYMVENLNDSVFPYTLQPWVTEELKKDRELLDNFHKVYENYV